MPRVPRGDEGAQMDLFLDDEAEIAADPMETVEEVISADERFASERAEDGEIHFSFKCSWGETVGYFSHRCELPAGLFTLGLDLQAPKSRHTEAVRLAGLINENLWLGHFDVWSDDGTIICRHAMPMIGRDEISNGEIQAMLAAALDAAERFQSVLIFHHLCPDEPALKVRMNDTCGLRRKGFLPVRPGPYLFRPNGEK